MPADEEHTTPESEYSARGPGGTQSFSFISSMFMYEDVNVFTWTAMMHSSYRHLKN